MRPFHQAMLHHKYEKNLDPSRKRSYVKYRSDHPLHLHVHVQPLTKTPSCFGHNVASYTYVLYKYAATSSQEKINRLFAFYTLGQSEQDSTNIDCFFTVARDIDQRKYV